MRLVLLLLLIFPAMFAAPAPRNVIVDTDAGSDDLLAIAFLLARADVNIEAITIVNGLAHVPAGAKNVLKLLELAGRVNIPVYEGRQTPLEGTNEFPETWRVTADSLPHVDLPETARAVEAISATSFLKDRLANARKPVSILALGPLTNLAEVLIEAPRSMLAIDDLVVMGGAIRAGGNLAWGGLAYSDNRTAEWNIYIDPAAAQRVFDTVTKCRMVPLDASNTVPFELAFVNEMSKSAKSKLGKFAAQVLGSNRMFIEQHMFFAWDPLAAVALQNPAVVKISSVSITIVRNSPEEGRTLESPTGKPIRVALSADPVLFRKIFLETLR